MKSQLKIPADRLTDVEAVCRSLGARLFYLFGSQARGQAQSMSDVDFAVEFGPEVLESAYPGNQEQFIVEMMRVMQRNDVDVAVLNNASALLQHRAATEGIVLFEREPGAHADFLVRALRAYDDTRSLRAATRASLQAR